MGGLTVASGGKGDAPARAARAAVRVTRESILKRENCYREELSKLRLEDGVVDDELHI